MYLKKYFLAFFFFLPFLNLSSCTTYDKSKKNVFREIPDSYDTNSNNFLLGNVWDSTFYFHFKLINYYFLKSKDDNKVGSGKSVRAFFQLLNLNDGEVYSFVESFSQNDMPSICYGSNETSHSPEDDVDELDVQNDTNIEEMSESELEQKLSKIEAEESSESLKNFEQDHSLHSAFDSIFKHLNVNNFTNSNLVDERGFLSSWSADSADDKVGDAFSRTANAGKSNYAKTDSRRTHGLNKISPQTKEHACRMYNTEEEVEKLAEWVHARGILQLSMPNATDTSLFKEMIGFKQDNVSDHQTNELHSYRSTLYKNNAFNENLRGGQYGSSMTLEDLHTNSSSDATHSSSFHKPVHNSAYSLNAAPKEFLNLDSFAFSKMKPYCFPAKNLNNIMKHIKYKISFHFAPASEDLSFTIGPFFVYIINPFEISCNHFSDQSSSRNIQDFYTKSSPEVIRLFAVQRRFSTLSQSKLNKVVLVLQEVKLKKNEKGENNVIKEEGAKNITNTVNYMDFVEKSFVNSLSIMQCEARLSYEYVIFLEGWSSLKRTLDLKFIRAVSKNYSPFFSFSSADEADFRYLPKKVIPETFYYGVTVRPRDRSPLKKIKDVIKDVDLTKYGTDEHYLYEAYKIHQSCRSLYISELIPSDLSCMLQHYTEGVDFPKSGRWGDKLSLNAMSLHPTFKSLIKVPISQFYWNIFVDYQDILAKLSAKTKYINHGVAFNTLLEKYHEYDDLIFFPMQLLTVCKSSYEKNHESLNTSEHYYYSLPFSLPNVRSPKLSRHLIIPRDSPTNSTFEISEMELQYKSSLYFNNTSSSSFDDYKSKRESWRDVLYESLHHGFFLTQQITRLSFYDTVWHNFYVDEFFFTPWVIDSALSLTFTENRRISDTKGEGICNSYRTEEYNENFLLAVVLKKDKEYNYDNFLHYNSQYIYPQKVFVFRGTGTPKLWITNFMRNLIPDEIFHTGGNIHHGYADLFLRSVKPTLDLYLEKLKKKLLVKNKLTSFLFVGYSLGGVMAVYSALYFLQNINAFNRFSTEVVIFTYGAPKMGDNDFITALRNSGIRLYQVASNVDPTPIINGHHVKKRFSSNDSHIFLNIGDISNYKTEKYDGKLWFTSLNSTGFKEKLKSVTAYFFNYYFPHFEDWNTNTVFTHFFSYACVLSLLSENVNKRGTPYWSSFCSPFLLKDNDIYFHEIDYYHSMLTAYIRHYKN